MQALGASLRLSEFAPGEFVDHSATSPAVSFALAKGRDDTAPMLAMASGTCRLPALRKTNALSEDIHERDVTTHRDILAGLRHALRNFSALLP